MDMKKGIVDGIEDKVTQDVGKLGSYIEIWARLTFHSSLQTTRKVLVYGLLGRSPGDT